MALFGAHFRLTTSQHFPEKIWVKKENNLLHTVGNNHIVGGLCYQNSKFQAQSQIMEKTKIAVAGTGYVGLSIATLLPSTIM